VLKVKNIQQKQENDSKQADKKEGADDKPPNSFRKIGITYNLKEDVLIQGEVDNEQVEELDQIDTIRSLSDVFEKNGYETVKLGGDFNVVDKIRQYKPDFVFNISEGYHGRNREGHIPAILEMMDIPYSGSDPLTLALTLDKAMTKKLLMQLNIPTPNCIVANSFDDVSIANKKLKYPLITKPVWEGSSKGIYNASKTSDEKALEKNVRYLFSKYPDQPVLIEEYIQGREITVGIVGNKPKSVFGIMEIASKSRHDSSFIYSLEVKRDWEKQAKYIVSPSLGNQLEEEITNYSLLAFNEFGCRDFARMDFRVSEDNKVYLLEINPIPGLSPLYSDFVIMSNTLGLGYEQLILSILDSALSRYGDQSLVQELLKVNSFN